MPGYSFRPVYINNTTTDDCLYKITPQAITFDPGVTWIGIQVDLLDDGMYSLSFYSVGQYNANNVVFNICVNKQQSGNNKYIVHTICLTGFTNIHLHTDANDNKYIRFSHNGNMNTDGQSNIYNYNINQL